MSNKGNKRFWENFHGPNMGYIEEQYDLYKSEPDAVDSSLKAIFDDHGAPAWMTDDQVQTEESGYSNQANIKKVTSAMKLVESIRRYGHLEADIYPVGKEDERYSPLVDPATYDLSDDDLKGIPANWVWEEAPEHVNNALEVVDTLKKIYSGKTSFEFDHVHNNEERVWLQEQVEQNEFYLSFSADEKKQLLKRLAEVEGFEHFLAKTFVAQKRFSIEGLDIMVPMLDSIIQQAIEGETEQIMMGMAHRGRLNVLAHVLGKPYELIFSEFHHAPNKELVPSEGSMGINNGWTGDVKYHFGALREVKNDNRECRVMLAHNPSHLEFVNPVVEGLTRAAQDVRTDVGYPKHNPEKAFNILIHGDAAFIGEGVVAETLNMSRLEGYKTGGTIHMIANNQVGFTTDQEEGRSTRYASDLAKGFEIPVIHVNADDPIACISAVSLAFTYRHKFHRDILIDLVGYRRYGHNEMDEPRGTQPKLYKQIDERPTVLHLFADTLKNDGTISNKQFDEIKEDVHKNLRNIYDNMKENEKDSASSPDAPEVVNSDLSHIETAVPINVLKDLNKDLLERPEDFDGFRKLERILQRRENALDDDQKVDWALGEALAFASILKDGTPIRITGQDTERGTFAHRHLVLYDVDTEESYCPMHGLKDVKASFAIHNSPLSENGVIGFEYGYSVHSPETLVIWEAQYGDFANAGQVIFDQFISAGRAKWGEKSNMVMLLPHGYEGQGPEHSSARLERFLQSAAESNWTVANVTSAAQYFHLLRRQAAIGGKEESRPLVLMTPKSLIRNQRVASNNQAFIEGKFKRVVSQDGLGQHKESVKRLIMGSGKIMVELEEALDNGKDQNWDWLHMIRLEQIYPFPEKEVKDWLDQYPNLEEFIWVQEEPKNMGSWDFIKETLHQLLSEKQSLRYIGRPNRSSPAVGEPNVHKSEQNRIINEVLTPSEGGDSGERN